MLERVVSALGGHGMRNRSGAGLVRRHQRSIDSENS